MKAIQNNSDLWVVKDYRSIHLNLTHNIAIKCVGAEWRLCFSAGRDGHFFAYDTEDEAQKGFDYVMTLIERANKT